MEMNEKLQPDMQKLSDEEMGLVAGGETRRVVNVEVCPICGQEITVPLATHMRGHPLVPCPACGNMMPAGPNATCYNCGYVSSAGEADGTSVKLGPGTLIAGTPKEGKTTIFLDSRC